MSRSYKKNIRIQMCSGKNVMFYKYRRRKNRHRLNQELHEASIKYDSEDIDDNINPDTMPKQDLWREPSDGHYGMNKDQYKQFKRENPGRNWRDKLARYYLKAKHK